MRLPGRKQTASCFPAGVETSPNGQLGSADRSEIVTPDFASIFRYMALRFGGISDLLNHLASELVSSTVSGTFSTSILNMAVTPCSQSIIAPSMPWNSKFLLDANTPSFAREYPASGIRERFISEHAPAGCCPTSFPCVVVIPLDEYEFRARGVFDNVHRDSRNKTRRSL